MKHHGADTVYGMGFIGALVYFLTHTTNFGEGVLGVIKAIVWPGIFVYRVLDLLK